MSSGSPEDQGVNLDPRDWTELRSLGHRMLDEMIDYMADIRDRPVWQPIPDQVRDSIRSPLPRRPSDPGKVYEEFRNTVLPYATGNVHPGFMGWVHGGGSAVGMLAEMLAAGLNANLGGRDHMPIEIERLIAEWCREMFGFPSGASGLFVTGTSMANLIALLVARTKILGSGVRSAGLGEEHSHLRAYTSEAAHSCIARAMDIAGFGTDALRRIPVDRAHRMRTDRLEEAIAVDRASGLTPFLVVGTAGTVDIGAIDDLAGLSRICKREMLTFHVDGAFGALAMMAETLAPLLQGIEKADSIAFDFHKWGQVPYDSGFILVRDGEMHRQTFSTAAAYLSRETRGLAAGSPWPCDLGPDLSRGFRALKTWFTLKTYGAEKLGAIMVRSCELAQYLKRCIESEPRLELLAPVALNIVCFRLRGKDADRLNAEIVVGLQESGIAAPSSTRIDGQVAIRCAFVNHRTQRKDVDAMLAAALAIGTRLQQRNL